jgi:hypothetical protein
MEEEFGFLSFTVTSRSLFMFRTFAVIIISLLTFLTTAMAAPKVHTFMPENDLWMEDSLSLMSAVDQPLFEEIIKAGYEAYIPFAQREGEKLVINALWGDGTVNANACRGCKPGEVTINMYGGLARRSEIIPEGFALVLCHELGHAYGGSPFISAPRQMSAEGQADYYATGQCYKKVAKKVPSLKSEFSPSDYIKQTCDAKFDAESQLDCYHSLEGGLSLGSLLATLMRVSAPKYETPDQTVVTRTELSYPKTVQCRLDTYHAGTLEMKRPACWFKERNLEIAW